MQRGTTDLQKLQIRCRCSVSSWTVIGLWQLRIRCSHHLAAERKNFGFVSLPVALGTFPI